MAVGISLGRFYGIDSLIELGIAVIAFIIFRYSNRIYKVIKEKDYRYFSWAFLSIGISFLFKIVSNLTFYHRFIIQRANFFISLTSECESMQIINFLSEAFFRLFFVVGFLVLFLIVTKTERKDKVFLFLYLTFITVLFSIYFDFVFHLTIIFISVALAVHFYRNYNKNKTQNSFLVFLSFLMLAISSLFFSFVSLPPVPENVFEFIGEIWLLAGFLSLLVNQVRLKNEEKNKTRDNKRHFRHVERE